MSSSMTNLYDYNSGILQVKKDSRALFQDILEILMQFF